MAFGRWQKEEMELKHIQAELLQQQAVLAKEVQDLRETVEVKAAQLGAGLGVGRPQD
jgi:hypothetical protein